MSSDEARARRSLVAPVQNSPQGDTLVVIERTMEDEEYRPQLLRVLARNGRWQPAKSLFEYVQQDVIETCARMIEDEAARNEWLCEVHVEVHGLWGKGVSHEAIEAAINSFLKDRWAVKSVNANEDHSLVVVGFDSEDDVDQACACQDIMGHAVTIIPTSLDRWEVYCAEDVVPGADGDYNHWFDDGEAGYGYGDNGLDTLLSCVTPDLAKRIVEGRRTEERWIRTLRVAAQRAHVPVECVRHIEAYTGLSARDAIPCQRAQLPAFMERLVDNYRELSSDRNLWHASVTSGFMGSDEIWKGSFDDHRRRLTGPGGLSNRSTETWTLFPHKLQQQYDNMRSSFGYSDRDDTSWTPGYRFIERPPGPAWTCGARCLCD